MAGGPIHKNYTTDDLHVPGYHQSSDPGAVGAGVDWLDTTASPPTLKRRNPTNAGWDTPLSGGGAPSGSAGGDLTGTYPNPTIGANKVLTASILNSNVTLAKLANIADLTVLGNNTGGSAAPVALTAAQVRTVLALVIGTNVEAWSAVLDALASVMSSTATAAAQRAAIGANGYDIGFFTPGVPTTSQLCLLFNAPRSVVLPASLTGSVGKATIAATAQTDFDIQVNGVSKGTIRFAASGTVPTYIFASPVTLAIADILTIIAPASADATLANVGVTILGTY